MLRSKVTRRNPAILAWRALSVVVALFLAACTGGSAAGQGDAASAPPPAPISYASAPSSSLPSPQASTAKLPKDVLKSIPTRPGDAPAAVFPGFGSVWVPSHRGTTLYRIDPRTDRVSARIPIGQNCFSNGNVGFGRVFLACEQSEVVVNPNTDRVVGTSDCGQYLSFSPNAIWSAGPNGIQSCSPQTYKRTHLYPIGDGYSGTAYGFGSVWAANGLQNTVTRFDPVTGKVTTIPADGIVDGDFDCHVLVAFGAVWNQCDPGDKIYRIDPVTNTKKVFHVDAQLLPDFYVRGLVAGLGSLWLTTSLSQVTRFDPATMKVLGRYPVDPSGLGSGAIAIEDGSLWLTNPEADSIWRDRVEP